MRAIIVHRAKVLGLDLMVKCDGSCTNDLTATAETCRSRQVLAIMIYNE